MPQKWTAIYKSETWRLGFTRMVSVPYLGFWPKILSDAYQYIYVLALLRLGKGEDKFQGALHLVELVRPTPPSQRNRTVQSAWDCNLLLADPYFTVESIVSPLLPETHKGWHDSLEVVEDNSGVAAAPCPKISLSAGFNGYRQDRYNRPAVADHRLWACY